MSESESPRLRDPRYIHSNFSIFYPKQLSVVPFVQQLNEILDKYYFPAQVLPVPEDAEPELPRLVFGSQHGFSQVIFSLTSVGMAVQYSPEWQKDLNLGHDYVLSRSDLLMRALGEIGVTPLFCGFSTTMRMSTDDESSMMKRLAERHAGQLPADNPNEIIARVSSVVGERFFRNFLIRSHRSWTIGPFQQGIVRLTDRDATEQGVELVLDFNDRYSFNSSESYRSGPEIPKQIVDSGMNEIRNLVARMEEGRW